MRPFSKTAKIRQKHHVDQVAEPSDSILPPSCGPCFDSLRHHSSSSLKLKRKEAEDFSARCSKRQKLAINCCCNEKRSPQSRQGSSEDPVLIDGSEGEDEVDGGFAESSEESICEAIFLDEAIRAGNIGDLSVSDSFIGSSDSFFVGSPDYITREEAYEVAKTFDPTPDTLLTTERLLKDTNREDQDFRATSAWWRYHSNKHRGELGKQMLGFDTSSVSPGDKMDEAERSLEGCNHYERRGDVPWDIQK